MASHQLTVTANGQITIPEELRHELGIDGGDRLYIERDETGLHLETARSRDLAVVRRTAGSLAPYATPTNLSGQELIRAEKEAFAQAIVDDYLETERRINDRSLS